MLISIYAPTEATSSSVDTLAAKGKPAATTSKSQFTCLIHGKNTMHDTRDCKVVRAAVEGAQKVKPKKEKKAKRVQDDNDTETESETKTVSQAPNVASPPHC